MSLISALKAVQTLGVFVIICLALHLFFQVCGNFAYLYANFAVDIDYCRI
jgi:hypothetical protein